MGRCLAAAVLLMASLALTAGEAGRLEAMPAWNGAYRAGAWTEVRASVSSELGGMATLAVSAGAAPPIEATVRLEAQTPRRVALPVRPEPGMPVRIEARLPDGRIASAELTLAPLAGSPWLALAAADIPAAELRDALPETAHLTPIPPAELPRHAQAYRPLDGLVLGEAEFAALDDQQREALAAYLRACGAVMFAGTGETFELLRAEAGCGAAGVRAAAGAAGIVAALAEVLERAHVPLPGASELRARLPAGHAAEVPIAMLLGGYGIALIAALRSSRRVWPLIVLPSSFAALALAGFAGKAPSTWAVVLAETDSGSGHARYSALLRVDGLGPRHGGLPVPPGSVTEPEAALRFHPDRPVRVELPLAASLWSRGEWRLQGTGSVETPLTLESGKQGIVVANSGAVPSPPGLMVAQGRWHALPALAPGARWSPPEDPEPLASMPEAAFLKPYLAKGETALMVPYGLSELFGPGWSVGSAWLVIRGAT